MSRYKLGRRQPKRLPRKLTLIFSVVMSAAGLYLLLLVLAPKLAGPGGILEPRPLEISTVEVGDHRVIIPEIGVNIDYLEGDASVLNRAAWHRFPERGDPVKGGNFILSAHRFEIGLTPQQTREKSPFYNIHLLDTGDQIFIDHQGQRYEYRIERKYSVKPDAVEIEAPSAEAKLTLYSCTLKGRHDGRDVVEAKLVQSSAVVN